MDIASKKAIPAAGQAQSDADRRRSRRWKVFKDAQLYLGNGRSVRCVVRDLSENGARLQVPGNIVIPEIFQLHIKADRVTMTARRVWSTLDQMGVRFIEE
jgi:hypothetical protein